MPKLAQPLPRPAPVLRVGIVGHTSLPNAAAVEQAIGEVLQAIRTIAEQCLRTATAKPLYAACAPTFRFVSNLAPGADQVGTGVALAQEFGEVVAILPLPQTDYVAAVRQSHAYAADELAKLADDPRVHCLVLPALSTSQGERQDERYAFASRLMIDHVDVLIAVWHGPVIESRSANVPSLTAQSIELARERNVPVVWIATGKADPLPHRFADAIVGAAAWGGADVRGELQTGVRALLDPYHAAVDVPTSPQRWRKVRRQWLEHVCGVSAHHVRQSWAAELSTSQRERQSHEEARAALWLAHDALRHVPRDPAGIGRLVLGWPVAIWQWLAPFRLGMRRARGLRERLALPPIGNAVAAQPAQPAQPLPALKAVGDAADGQADLFMARYRAIFSHIFGLGALAVALAVGAYLSKVADFRPFGVQLGVVFAAVELVVVFAILGMHMLAHASAWHQRGTDLRLVAEAMRQAQWINQAFYTIPRPRLDGHVQHPHEPLPWPQWYVQAKLREYDFGFAAGMRILAVDLGHLQRVRDGIVVGLVLHQANWYRDGAFDHSVYLERTHSWEVRLFLCVLAACVASVTFCFLPIDHHSVAYAVTMGAALFLAAALPAFAAALHGIAAQGELQSIHKKYHRMAPAMLLRAEALQALGDDFTLADLQREVAMASSAMFAEVQDWYRSYGGHPPPLV